ncbi:MAG TPA: retropepsin-like aspartic protease [Rhizomicrobium sp.]|nr:retropepsin-like aspartic protease [Rhizomicrobium sp.]
MFRQALAGVVALLGLNMTAAAQTPAPTSTCSVPSVTDTVDLKPVAGTDQVTVPVTINGTEKQFLLDIGTDHTEISATAARDLKLPGGNQSTDALLNSSGYSGTNANGQGNFNMGTSMQAAMFDVSGSRSAQDYAPRVRVADFTIGDATGHNMQLIVANDKEMGRSELYDGRMTGDFFAQYDIDFDFGAKKLSFLTATNCTEKEIVHWPATVVAIVPMTISGGKMKVPVTVEGKTINAVIDTGFAHTVMRRDIAESLGLKADAPDMVPDGEVRDGLGQTVYVHTFPQISFSGITAANVPVRIQTNSMVHQINRTPILGSRAQFSADPSTRVPDLAIGMDVLHQLHIYAAFGENKLYITPAEATPPAAAPTAPSPPG